MKSLNIIVFCIVVITANSSPKNDSMNDILNQLDAGETRIKLDNRYKDIVLVLGVTGTGKSTLVQFIAGDNSKLIAKRVSGGVFVIEDTSQRISDSKSTFDSNTEFPELIIDNNTDAAFYDCPGFSDTRSTAKDIGTTYFIKKLTEFSNRVKLVFVVSFSAVQPGRDRSAFLDLLKHITTFVNDVNRFESSIALAVTKVDNLVEKKGKVYMPISDRDVINGIAEFLLGLRQVLNDEKDKEFGTKAAEILRIMLDKDNDTYTRIGIFRTPDEEGSLDKSELLQEGKQNLNRIVHDNLKFVETEPETFGYTISEKSKLELFRVVDELNDYIYSVLGKIAADINRHYKRLATDKPSEVGERLNLGFNIFSIFLANITVNTTGQEYVGALLNSVTSAQINMSVTQLNEIHKKFKFVFFLEQVSGLRFKTNPLEWIDVFRSISRNIKTNVEYMQKTIASRLSYLILKHTMSIKSYFSEAKDDTSFLAKTIKGFPVLNSLVTNFQAQQPNSLTIAFLNFFTDSRVADMHEATSDLESNLDDTIALQAFGLHAVDETLITKVNTLLIESKSELMFKLTEVAKKINNVAERLSDTIRADIDENFITFKNVLRLDEKLHELNISLANIENASKESMTAKNTTDFINICEKIGLNIDDTDMLLKYETYCDSLSNITNIPMKFNLNYKLFSPALSYLKTQVNWYTYLDKLDNALNSETVQTRRTFINSQIFGQNDGASFNSGIKFFDSLVSSSALNDFQPTENNRNEFNNLTALTLSNSTSSCTGNGQLVITGYNVLMSEIVSANCPYQYEQITVFAFNAIFLDAHYQNNVQMSIISPQWNVVGRVAINLSGTRGASQEAATDGQDGRPGYPGSQGGNLLALASVYNNANLLTVNVSGGDGGDGQNGGVGRHGSNGDNAELARFESKMRRVWNGISVMTMFRIEQISSSGHLRTYVMHGLPGTTGSSGGNGGVGGDGGYSGHARFMELSGASPIITINKDHGRRGSGRTGGQPGKGGRNGDTVNIRCHAVDGGQTWCSQTATVENGYARDGSKGRDDYNSANKIGAVYRNRTTPVDAVVNQYVESYLKQANDGIYLFSKSSMAFVSDLYTNSKIAHEYSALGYVEAFKLISNSLIIPHSDRQLMQTNYMNNLLDYSVRADSADKILINYLYLAMYATYISDKEQFSSNMVIYLSDYLKLGQQNIAKTQITLQNHNRNINNDYIRTLNNNYNKEISTKINEAQRIIQTEIIGEVDAISVKIDSNIGSLLSEIEVSKSAAVEDKKQLVIKRDMLRQQLKLKKTFGILKIFASALSFIPNVGTIVSGIVSSGLSVAESMVVKDSTRPNKPLQLPEGVRNAISRYNQNVKELYLKETKINKASKLLKLITGIPELTKLVDNVGMLAEKLSNVNDINEFKKLDSELDSVLDATEKKIKISRSMVAFDIFKKGLNVAQTIGSTIQGIQKGGSQIEELDYAIKTAQANFENLGSYRVVIDNMVVPMLYRMTSDMNNVITNMKSKSRVSLDITKWKVNDFLTNMKIQIQQFTKGFQAEAEFSELIVKLTHAIDVTVTVYGRIDTYKDQQKLADYIANVNTPLAINTNKYSKLIVDLELNIMANILRDQYSRALASFKQWVFPFADLYLIDQNNERSRNLTRHELIADAISRINLLNRELIEYKTTIVKKKDKNLFFKIYNSQLVSSHPFYSWSNHSSRRIIAKFVTGQKVTVLADVRKSHLNEDAIKFNLIKLSLITDNTEIQSKVIKILQHCEISMTHMGHSQYRYNRKYYTISHDTQTITYSIEMDSHGNPITTNSVYQKIKSGDILLSPYATWTFKLNCLIHRNYLELKHYRDHLRLELNGEGSFVRTTSLDLGKHYTAI